MNDLVTPQSRPIAIECCITSCGAIFAGGTIKAVQIGWRKLKEDHSNFKSHRTHLAWCPDCAKKYRVV